MIIQNLQVSGNSKSIIIPKSFLDEAFGILNKEQMLKKILYIFYDENKKELLISKNRINDYFGIAKKMVNIGESFGILIPIKFIRHIFSDMFDITYKSKDLKVVMDIDVDTIKLKKWE